MKKIIISSGIFIMLLNSSISQSIDTSTYTGKMDFIFQHVNKAPITSGLLQEYGIDFTKLNHYTGFSSTDSNYTGLMEWRLLYASLYSMQIVHTNPLPSLQTINTQIDNYTNATSPITFVGLYYNYQSLVPNAAINNLVYKYNEQMYCINPLIVGYFFLNDLK